MNLNLEQPQDKRFVVDFWVTGKCDMECPFCYGADVPIKENQALVYHPTDETKMIAGSDKRRPEMSFEQTKDVILKLKNVGVDTLTFSGGEPLLRNETPSIIEFAHKHSMQIYLSTNGTYLLSKYSRIKNFISVLGLPLDGSNPEINIAMGRKAYHFKNIKNILEFFYNHPPNHILKVGTIVSKVNLDDIEAIGKFLFETVSFYSPDVWRLYQFESLKDGLATSDKYAVTDDEFLSVCDIVKKKFPINNISERSRSTHSNSYFFVTPDGMLQTVSDKHTSIADLLLTDENELKNIVEQQHSTVIKRASQNRNWLNSKNTNKTIP